MKSKKKSGDKKFRILLYTLLFLVFCNLGLYAIYKMSDPVSIRNDIYVLQVNSEFDPYDNLQSVFLGNKEDVKISGDDEIDLGTVGDYYVTYTYNGKPYRFTVSVKDQEPPVLVCQDYSTDLVENIEESSFIKSVSDDSIFSIKMESSASQGTAGTTPVTITATDQYGNSTSKTVNLTRTEDKEAPVLEGFEDYIEVNTGTNFSADYVVTDNLDSNPSLYVDSSSLDVNEPGTYTVTYTVRDRSGNEKVYTQTVEVIDRKVAYLTFDDGPSANTKKVLDILDQYGIKATFFVTAQDPDYFDYMKEASDAGHTVALHTYSHDYGTVYSSTDAYFQDLNAIKDIVKKYTGKEADCIRFPGGSSNTISANYSYGIMSALTEMVQQAGYQYFDWNVSSGDAAGNNVPAETILANVSASIGEPNAVFLFHDTDAKDTTVEALPAIIEAYQAAGYVFEPLTKDSYPAHHGVNN